MEPGPVDRDQSRIVGYVYNDHREDAVNVQLRIIQLDDSGRPVDSIVRSVGDTVRAGGRAFLELRVPGKGLRDQGKIRVIGVSHFSPDRMTAFPSAAPLRVVQPPYKRERASCYAHRTLTTLSARFTASRSRQLRYETASGDIFSLLALGSPPRKMRPPAPSF